MSAMREPSVWREGPREAVDLSLNTFFLHSAGQRPKLRVGLLTNGHDLPRYGRRIVEDILASDYAEVACCVQTQPASELASSATNQVRRFIGALTDAARRGAIAYGAYLKYYDSPRRPEPDPRRLVDCRDLLAAIPTRVATPAHNGFVDRLVPGDVEWLRAFQPDVLLRFGFRILRGDVLEVARHGIWSYHHGDSARYRGGPPHLWELVEGNPISGVVLQRLNEELDAGFVLAKGLFATSPSLSVSVNQFGPYWSAAHFVIRSLHELHATGRVGGHPESESGQRYGGRRPIYRAPDNAQTARWLTSEMLKRLARRATGRRYSDGVATSPATPRWQIGLRQASVALYDELSADAACVRTLGSFRWLENPAGAYRADPFFLARHGTLWMFYEEYADASQRGAIGAALVGPSGDLVDARIVMRKEYHLSFPYVFEHTGEIFMVPESAASGTVDLYRATRFPDEWVLECTLLRLCCVDSTLFEHDGRWWLVTTPRIVPGHAALSYLWSAASLFGPWTLAAHSPLSHDVRHARSAGTVFAREDGRLCRPTQDCSGSYGRAVQFNRIEQLAPVPRQTAGPTLLPSLRGLLGVHTYNRAGTWEAVDGLFTRRLRTR